MRKLCAILLFIKDDQQKRAYRTKQYMRKSFPAYQKFSTTEMEITKNKNPQARLYIFYRFLNPYPRVQFSVWKSQTFGKSLETFASRISFLKFLKIHRLVLIFQWIFGCFKSVSSKYIFKKPTKKRARVKSIVQKETHDCDSTADKVSRHSSKIISVTSISGVERSWPILYSVAWTCASIVEHQDPASGIFSNWRILSFF